MLVLIGNLIKVYAEFKKSLPFYTKMNGFKDKLLFKNQKVSSFGFIGYIEYEQLTVFRILYYKNDNNFILKLVPKNLEHEILLFKTEKKFNTIIEMNNEIEKLKEIGKKERVNEKINWRYFYSEEDEIIIPKINFNIESSYPTMTGNKFKDKNTEYVIETMTQRTAFILDENGAEIESEAYMESAVEVEEEYEKPKPKKMTFDKPFLILLKRTNVKNPYFGFWVANTELMIKE